MKVRMTVTVELDDPHIYDLDKDGWPVGESLGVVGREGVGEYVLEAVRYWGGQFAPGSPLFSRNIRSVRVKGAHFDIKME